MSSETALSRDITRALEGCGIVSLRIQCGRVRVGGHWMYGAKKGTFDRICLNPQLLLEVKDEEPPSKDQLEFFGWCERNKVPAAFVWSVSHALKAVNCTRLSGDVWNLCRSWKPEVFK